MAGSYRIILGDTCTICRAVSRITFTQDRPPQIPIAGCRAEEGCRCKLPIFEDRTAFEPPEPGAAVEMGAAAAEVRPAPKPQPSSDWSKPAPITQMRRQSLRNLTALHRHQRIQGIRILTATDCCSVCKEVAASIYDPSIAPPIPIAGCANGWNCRCMYGEEPLPLDEHGQRAMDRLAELERERELRRAGVPIGGPRWVHGSALTIATAVVVFSLHLLMSTQATSPVHRAAMIAETALAAGVATVAVLAIRRLRPVPSPPWVYAIFGACICFLALFPLVVVLPWGPVPDWNVLPVSSMLAALMVGGGAQISSAQGIVAASGLALMLLGLVGFFTGRESY